MDILNATETFLKKYKLLNIDTHFLIGFSGGADSMLLLYCLKELQNKYNFKISALHINHGWRGNESDNEEKICKNFCKKLSIDFYCEKLSEKIKHDENSARIARYDLFNKYSKKLKVNAILTAHNSTDVVETFIYRLIKGTGTIGAASIPEIRNALYCKVFRPFINISSKEIRKECEKRNLKYNFDSSNNNNKYKRNFIRNEILPKFEEINQSYEDAILSYIENLKSNNKLLENFYTENCDNVINDNKIDTQEFIGFSDDVKRVIVYKFLKNNNFEPEKALISRIIRQIEKNSDKPNGKKYSIKKTSESPMDFSFFCSKESCYFIKNSHTKLKTYKFENKFTKPITVNKYEGKKIPKSNEFEAVVNKNELVFPLELRTRNLGDIIQPFSHNSTVKLKDYFIDKKIPEHKRDSIPLLCKGKEVLWAIGVGLSEKLRADLDCHKDCIILKYEN